MFLQYIRFPLRKCTAQCSISVSGLLLNVGVKLLMTYSENKTCYIHGRSWAPHSPVSPTAIHLSVPKTTVRNFCQKLAFGDVCKEQSYRQRQPSECDDVMICINSSWLSFVRCPSVPRRVPCLTGTGFSQPCPCQHWGLHHLQACDFYCLWPSPLSIIPPTPRT